MSDDDKPIDLHGVRLSRHMLRFYAEYERIRPMFEAIRAGSDAHHYVYECIRQLGGSIFQGDAGEITLEDAVEGLLTEADMDTQAAIEVLDKVKARLLKSAKEGALFNALDELEKRLLAEGLSPEEVRKRVLAECERLDAEEGSPEP